MNQWSASGRRFLSESLREIIGSVDAVEISWSFFGKRKGRGWICVALKWSD
jgi:hypothetical protein